MSKIWIWRKEIWKPNIYHEAFQSSGWKHKFENAWYAYVCASRNESKKLAPKSYSGHLRIESVRVTRPLAGKYPHIFTVRTGCGQLTCCWSLANDSGETHLFSYECKWYNVNWEGTFLKFTGVTVKYIAPSSISLGHIQNWNVVEINPGKEQMKYNVWSPNAVEFGRN